MEANIYMYVLFQEISNVVIFLSVDLRLSTGDDKKLPVIQEKSPSYTQQAVEGIYIYYVHISSHYWRVNFIFHTSFA